MFKSITLCSAFSVVFVSAFTFSANAQASLQSYSIQGTELVYSVVSDVSWTKDANLLGSQFINEGFITVVNKIIAASPTITNSFNTFSPTGTYSILVSDFNSNGTASWFGAMAYVNYLNSISYGSSNKWYLPTVVNSGVWNPSSNGVAKGDELKELFYQDLMGRSFDPMPNTETFNNEQSRSSYWTGTEGLPGNVIDAWLFGSFNGSQVLLNKDYKFFVWAVTPGRVSAVPEPAISWLFLSGLCTYLFLCQRRKTLIP